MIEWLRRFLGGKGKFPKVPAPIDLPGGPLPAAPLSPAPARNSKAVKRGNEEKAILDGSASAGFRCRALNLSGAKEPFALPDDLRCFRLDLSRSGIQSLPASLRVEYKIDLSDTLISELPAGLQTGSLILSRCQELRRLPENLGVNFLNIEGCAALENWPASARVSVGSVNARGCAALQSLPAGLGPLTNLDLSGCARLDSLPPGLRVSGWLDIAGTGIRGLPESLQDVRLRWRGVIVDARVVFAPETMTPAEILAERNAEVRRIMIERHGLENFLKGAGATVLDEDTDPGGRRQLLGVPMPGDEDLVCVSLLCPSTGRHYIVRVPPGTKTCRQAVAWTAGFDDPDDYHPIVET